MPCCAFAAFILSQIVLGFGVVKRLVLRSGDAINDVPDNPATQWRLIGSVPEVPAASGRRLGLRTIALAASIEIVLGFGAIYGYHLHTHHHHQSPVASAYPAIRALVR
jgi:hypothetical protein